MRKSVLIAGAAMAFASMSAASAAPGPKILTTSGQAERASSTSGVTLQDVGGVTLIKGRVLVAAADDDAALLGAEPAKTDCGKVIVKVETPYRRLRHLRTQGFYSGKGYASRLYTQGFYSTGR